MNTNRRLQERKQPERMVFCKLGGEESSLVLDLSEDGLRFESLTPVEEKDLLELRLSVDVNSAIEATGKLAWIDSAKRTGGLRFLDLSAPAREQIRAWLSETSTADSGTNGLASLRKSDYRADEDSATEKPVIWPETRAPSTQLVPSTLVPNTQLAPSTQLVPIERYQAQTRAQFLRGVLVGFGVCLVVMIPIFRYAGTAKPGGLARTAASGSRATPSSGEPTQASVAQPAAASAPIAEPVAKPLASKPVAVQTVFAAAPTGSRQKQGPQTTRAFSADLMTRASSPPARPQAAKAEQPLVASPAVAIAPAAPRVHSSSGQAQPPKKISATAQQLWSALQAGNIDAAVALADLYMRGEGVPVNCEQARVLLLAASAKNNAEASKKLQALNKGGCPANRE